MKSYKLRNMPDSVHQMLVTRQNELKASGRFVSLERIIYILLKENSKKS